MLYYLDPSCMHLVKNAEIFKITLQKPLNYINNYV